MITLPTKYKGDTIEFMLHLGIDMTGQTTPSNPGGIMVLENNPSVSTNVNKTILDITTGKFYLWFDTSNLVPGTYRIQLWWHYNDSNGYHSISTDKYIQKLEQRLSGPP